MSSAARPPRPRADDAAPARSQGHAQGPVGLLDTRAAHQLPLRARSPPAQLCTRRLSRLDHLPLAGLPARTSRAEGAPRAARRRRRRQTAREEELRRVGAPRVIRLGRRHPCRPHPPCRCHPPLPSCGVQPPGCTLLVTLREACRAATWPLPPESQLQTFSVLQTASGFWQCVPRSLALSPLGVCQCVCAQAYRTVVEGPRSHTRERARSLWCACSCSVIVHGDIHTQS